MATQQPALDMGKAQGQAGHRSRHLKTARAPFAGLDVAGRVATMIDDVEREGLRAVRRHSRREHGWDPERFAVGDRERRAAVAALDDDLFAELDYALGQVRTFARHQLAGLRPLDVELHPGIHLGHRLRPVRSVGAYVDAGRRPAIAPAFTTIAVAKMAGVGRVVALAPPATPDGIHRVQLAAMHLADADEIFAIGGALAPAAAAFGGDELGAPVAMLVGPGDVEVTEARRQLAARLGIAAPSGASGLTILADDTADPVLLAYDLLGQAEHGPTAVARLVTTSEALGRAVLDEVPRRLEGLESSAAVSAAWRDHGEILVCADAAAAVAVVNELAPGALEVQTRDPQWYFERLDAYGTIFLGSDAGARFAGGVWAGSFLRVLAHQRVEHSAARPAAEAAMAIAQAEGLAGHALSARMRLEGLRDTAR